MITYEELHTQNHEITELTEESDNTGDCRARPLPRGYGETFPSDPAAHPGRDREVKSTDS